MGYTGIRIRGTDGTRINVTLNGIPYNDVESQATYWVDLPDFASSANSIQIQRGVGTSSNGGGAFGASINLSTNELNKDFYAEANNSYGSYNTWKNTLKFGTGLLGKHFTIDGRLSHISSDGYIERAKTSLRSYYVSTGWTDEKNSVRLNIFSGKERGEAVLSIIFVGSCQVGTFLVRNIQRLPIQFISFHGSQRTAT